MPENVDVARSIYADWERGEFASTDWAHPDIDWTAIGGPEPSGGKGIASLDAAWRDFLAAWGDYRVVAEEFRSLDAERVLVLLTAHARGRASGLIAEGGTRGANLLRIRDAKVVEFCSYWDRERAFADLGLQE
jgi:ketosteroid isomerase-like protein